MEFGTGAMGTLLPKLGELLLDEYNLKDRVKQGIKDLKAELESMEAALLKVSDVPLDQLDPQVKIWANKVREMSYVIEDSLDSSMVRIEGLEPTKPHSFKGFIKNTRNKVTKFKARHALANDIKEIESKVRKVKERYDRYKISDVVANLATTIVDPRISALYRKVSDLVGVDKSMVELIKRLSEGVHKSMDELIKRLSEGIDMPNKNLKIVSVVGFGGLGKTTLTKAVYDKLIKKKFDCGGFVPVGQNPDMKKVLKDILLELDKQKYINITTSRMDERQLIDELREFLQDKRYLIVIDDIWDIRTWEVIKCGLVDSNPGSRIIITTRNVEVATKVGGVYEIKPLSDDNSKKLFYARIFGGEGTGLDKEYVEVTNKILRKCGGVPLSIITMASLLVGKRMEDWTRVYDSIGFGHGDNEAVQNTRKILSYSYYDLPPCLKSCLLHLTVFPEDYMIDKTSTIWRWIAEGFIPNKPGIGLFELGESYFNELVNKSMIRWIEHSETVEFSFLCVHDMVLDLIRTLSREVNFVTIQDRENTYSSQERNDCVHRLAIHYTSIEHNPSMEMRHVRSFNASQCPGSRMPHFMNLKLLRVLALDYCVFPPGGWGLKHIGKLLQLRYLGLVGTSGVGLPREIGRDLKHLQALDIRGSDIEELPASVGELRELMCLRANNGTRMMGEIGKLTSLEELELHHVDKSPNFATELAKLTELRVVIVCFDQIDEREYKAMVDTSLRNFPRIQTLEIASNAEQPVHVGRWDSDQGWLPPSQLRKLALCDVTLQRRPSWVDSSYLPYVFFLNIVVATMEARDLEIIGKLPSLRFLFFRCGGNYASYTVGSGEFLKLQSLDTNIHIICGGDGALPMLEELACPVVMGKQTGVGQEPENMPLLQRVTYWLDCKGCGREEVEAAEAELMNAAEAHPNHPALKIIRENYEFPDDDGRSGEDLVRV